MKYSRFALINVLHSILVIKSIVSLGSVKDSVTQHTSLSSKRLVAKNNSFNASSKLKTNNENEFNENILNQLSNISRDYASNTKTDTMKTSLLHLVALDPYYIKQSLASNETRNFLIQNKNDAKSKIKHRGINHITQLYNDFKDGHFYNNNDNINTIRLIPAVRITSNKKLMFKFNLSLLSNSEKLVKAELYINKKFIKHRFKFALKYFLNKELERRQSDSATIIDLENFRFGNGNILKRNPWQMFNIIDSLSSYFVVRSNEKNIKQQRDLNRKNNTFYYTINNLKSSNEEKSEFTLIMEAHINSRNKKSLYKIDSNDLSNPYLIIYSKEDDKYMKDFFQNRLPSELIKSSENSNGNEQSKKIDWTKSYVNDEELLNLKKFEEEVDKMNELNDKNEIEPISYLSSNDTSIKIFEPLESNAKLNNIETLDSKNEFNRQKTKRNSKYLELGFFIKDKQPPQKHIKRSDLDDSLQLLPEESNWEVKEIENNLNGEHICKAKSLTMDFQDLSFSGWILEPKSFQSNICSGVCKFSHDEVITLSF
jgi:hypothetical protein